MTGEHDRSTLRVELRPHSPAHLVGFSAKHLRVNRLHEGVHAIETLWCRAGRQPFEIAVGTRDITVRAGRDVDDDFATLGHEPDLGCRQPRATPTPRSNPTLLNPQIRTGVRGVWRCVTAIGAATANPAIPPTNAPRRSSAKSHCSFVSTRTAATTPRTPPTRAPPNSPGFPAPLPRADPITAPRPASAHVAMNTGMGFKRVPLSSRPHRPASRRSRGLLLWYRHAVHLDRYQPRHAAVGIGHHPGGGRQRPRTDELGPIGGAGACYDDGYPHQQREQAQLQRRERGCQPGIHTNEHRHARRDEGTAGEDRPRHVPWQPARHQRDGSFEISEMGYAEGDQTQAVKHPRDAQTLVAGGETEALTVPVTGEPRVENPSGRRHPRGVTAGPPSNRG